MKPLTGLSPGHSGVYGDVFIFDPRGTSCFKVKKVNKASTIEYSVNISPFLQKKKSFPSCRNQGKM